MFFYIGSLCLFKGTQQQFPQIFLVCCLVLLQQVSGVKILRTEASVSCFCFVSCTSHSHVTQSCLTLCDPMGCSLPGFSVHGIFQAMSWSGLPFPSPGDLPNPGIEAGSPALWTDALPSEPPEQYQAQAN